MRLLRVLFGIFLAASIGWTVPQSEETIGNLKFNLPPGWTKTVYRNEISVKPGDVAPSEWCTVTIRASLQASGDLVQWVNKQAEEFIGRREVLMKTPIPYQDDPKGWEGCGLSFAVRVNANTPTYYHMFIGFRRGDVAGTMHFVTDKSVNTQKYQEGINLISSSLKPTDGFSGTGGGPPPPKTPTGPPTNPAATTTNPAGPPSTAPNTIPVVTSGLAAANSREVYMPGALPSPAKAPEGSVDVAAASLAKRILKGGPDGLAALERAVLMSGFSIHEMPGKASLFASQTPNGMSFADIDLIGANALVDCGSSFALSSLEASFRSMKGLDKLDFITLWKKSIDAASASPKTSDKFYGAIMKALGSHSEGRFSHFSTLSPKGRLCPAQLFLLAWRSAGHIIAAGQDESLVPHGPFIGDQDSQADAVDSSTQIGNSLSNIDWSTAVKEWVMTNDTTNTAAFIMMSYKWGLFNARRNVILACIEWFSKLSGDRPLVRSKTYQETGEDRDLLIGVRFAKRNREASKKLTAAIDALGLPWDELDKTEDIHVRYRGEGNETIRPNKQNQAKEAEGTNGYRVFAVPIQGSPQNRKLSADPARRKTRSTATIEVRVTPKRDPSRFVGDEFWDRIHTVSMEIECDVPVQDWGEGPWEGSLWVTVQGNGEFEDGENSGRWSVDRSFVVSSKFGYLTPSTMVTRRPSEQGAYSVLPTAPEMGRDSVSDEHFLKGDIGGCGKLIGERKTTWKTRKSLDRIESQGLMPRPALEFHPSEKTYAIAFFGEPPVLPATRLTVEKTKTRTTYLPTANVRLSLFDGVQIKDLADVRAGRIVLDIKETEGGEFSGTRRAAYAYSGFYKKKEGIVIVQFTWALSQGGQSEPSLQNIAGTGLAFLQMEAWTSRTIQDLMELKQNRLISESEEIATCYETEVAKKAKLKHAKVQR